MAAWHEKSVLGSIHADVAQLFPLLHRSLLFANGSPALADTAESFLQLFLKLIQRDTVHLFQFGFLSPQLRCFPPNSCELLLHICHRTRRSLKEPLLALDLFRETDRSLKELLLALDLLQLLMLRNLSGSHLRVKRCLGAPQPLLRELSCLL